MVTAQTTAIGAGADGDRNLLRTYFLPSPGLRTTCHPHEGGFPDSPCSGVQKGLSAPSVPGPRAAESKGPSSNHCTTLPSRKEGEEL